MTINLSYSYGENIYIDLNGVLHFREFPKPGLWKFDGQFFYPLPIGDMKG